MGGDGVRGGRGGWGGFWVRAGGGGGEGGLSLSPTSGAWFASSFPGTLTGCCELSYFACIRFCFLSMYSRSLA